MEQAGSLIRSGRFAEAESCYRQALQLTPDAAGLHVALGRVLQAQGRVADAIESMEAALRLAPDSATAAGQLSRLLLAAGDPRAALRQCLVALRQGMDDRQLLQHFIHLLYVQPDAVELVTARDAILGCFDAGGVDLQQLSRPVTEILGMQPMIPDLLILAGQGRLQELRQRLQATGAVDTLCNDELLLRALAGTLLCDPGIEVLLRAVRRVLLDAVCAHQGVTGWPGAGTTDCRLPAALACQCLTNEFCFLEEPEEEAALQVLESELTRSLEGGEWNARIDPARLAVYAMYRPLSRLPGAERLELQDGLPDDRYFRAMLELHWYGPREQQEIRAAVPAITPIDDATSCKVREMYEESPYPPWQTVTQHEPGAFTQQAQRMFPGVTLPDVGDGELQMLVAGCGTGKQAIMAASRFAGTRLLAVDLSLTSLSYAVRKTRQLGIENITFAQADILRLDTLPQRFHVIESVGVLHHMSDPERGLAVLTGLLRPGGLIRIGLYSEIARRHIAELQEQLQQAGWQGTVDGIRQARATILAGDSEGCVRVRRLADFYSISGCRDLLFHVQERRYRLPGIAALLAGAGLRFLGFGWNDQRVPARYRQEHPDDPFMRDLSKWDAFEQRHPDTFLGMYVFWCQKA